MEKLVYLITPSVINGRRLRFELIKSDIDCVLHSNAESAVLNALFNQPHLVLVDTAMGEAEVLNVRRLLSKDHFHAGFKVVAINLSAHGSEGRQLLMQVQRMVFEQQPTAKPRARKAA